MMRNDHNVRSQVGISDLELLLGEFLDVRTQQNLYAREFDQQDQGTVVVAQFSRIARILGRPKRANRGLSGVEKRRQGLYPKPSVTEGLD